MKTPLLKKNANYNLLCTLLKQENWSFLNNSTNVNELIDIFYTKLNTSIDKSSFVVKLNSKNKIIKEWMTKGLLTSARRKNDLSKMVSKHPNNIKLREYYIKFRNHFTTLLRARKISFYKSEFSNTSTNPKLTWKLINNLTKNSINTNNEIFKNNIESNGQIINLQVDPLNTANIFNSFFLGIGEDLATKFRNNSHNINENITNSQNVSFR